MENEFDVEEDISNTSEDSDLYSEEVVTEEIELDTDEEEEVDWKAKYEAELEARRKADEIAKNQKIRAEKAERKPKVEPQETKQDLSTKDVLVLVQANVPSDDIDEVVEYARFKNIPVAEALKASAVKAILAERQENRTVAEATNTGTVKRGSSKISDDALLSKASKGELPDSDDEMRRLIRLRKGIK